MADPTIDQRTPNVRLRFESDSTRNYNWSKLDDAIGKLGGGSVAPPAITAAVVAEGHTIIQTLSLPLNTPVTLAQITALAGTPKKGPSFITGYIPITCKNLTATIQPIVFNMEIDVYGPSESTAIVTDYGFDIPPSVESPFLVPVSTIIMTPDDEGGAPCTLIVTKGLATDATVTARVTSLGYLQMIEFAAP
jgi:hypothetical protein